MIDLITEEISKLYLENIENEIPKLDWNGKPGDMIAYLDYGSWCQGIIEIVGTTLTVAFHFYSEDARYDWRNFSRHFERDFDSFEEAKQFADDWYKEYYNELEYADALAHQISQMSNM